MRFYVIQNRQFPVKVSQLGNFRRFETLAQALKVLGTNRKYQVVLVNQTKTEITLTPIGE